MFSQSTTYALAQCLKVRKLLCLAINTTLVYDVDKVVCEHERNTFASHTKLLLEVPKDVTKVDMK